MSNLENAKERLKSALTRLETAIESKITRLEIENNRLRGEVANLSGATAKDDTQPVQPKKRQAAVQKELLTDDEVMLSLNDLKKIVG